MGLCQPRRRPGELYQRVRVQRTAPGTGAGRRTQAAGPSARQSLALKTCHAFWEKRFTHLPLDVHPMIEQPEKYIKHFACTRAAILTEHEGIRLFTPISH